MDIQVVQYQMDRLCLRICHRHSDRDTSELEARAIRRRESEMAARLRLYGTENIGGPAALIFVIPSRFSSWNRRRGGPQIGVQRDRLLIDADYRVFWGVRPVGHQIRRAHA